MFSDDRIVVKHSRVDHLLPLRAEQLHRVEGKRERERERTRLFSKSSDCSSQSDAALACWQVQACAVKTAMDAGASTQNGAGGGAGADLDHYQSKSLARSPAHKTRADRVHLQSFRSRSPPPKTKSKRRESAASKVDFADSLLAAFAAPGPSPSSLLDCDLTRKWLQVPQSRTQGTSGQEPARHRRRHQAVRSSPSRVRVPLGPAGTRVVR